MKRIAWTIILTFLSFFLAGCVVQSPHPFYSEKAVVDPPRLEGEWLPIKDAGKEVSGKGIRPWIFNGGWVGTFDEKGKGSTLGVRYFKVDDALFVDVMAGAPDVLSIDKWWHLHVVAVHPVAWVTIKGDTLVITPLNNDWVENAVRAARATLVHTRLDGAGMIVFNADSDTRTAFLNRYRDDEYAFTDRQEHVFKKREPEGVDLMKGSKKIPDDFGIRYRWREGSLPPPDHYEYTIRLGPGTEGSIVFLPDYPAHNPPIWTERFEIDRSSMERLYGLLEEKGIFTKKWTETDESTGGALESVKITAGGREFTVPGGIKEAKNVEEIYGLVRSIVPEDVWDAMISRRERFLKDYRQAR